MGGLARILVSLLVPVRSPPTPVTPATRSAAPSRPFVLHGCRDHAVPATWLGQPCSKSSARVVPKGLTRLLRPCDTPRAHTAERAAVSWQHKRGIHGRRPCAGGAGVTDIAFPAAPAPGGARLPQPATA